MYVQKHKEIQHQIAVLEQNAHQRELGFGIVGDLSRNAFQTRLQRLKVEQAAMSDLSASISQKLQHLSQSFSTGAKSNASGSSVTDNVLVRAKLRYFETMQRQSPSWEHESQQKMLLMITQMQLQKVLFLPLLISVFVRRSSSSSKG